MDEFLIPDAAGSGGLLFYDRSPYDPAEPIGSFWARVTTEGLSAAGRVYAGYAPSHPAKLFANMAERWSGWSDELSWLSWEGELALRCRHDRLGHISIRVELVSGFMDDDWCVAATIMAEAGQLEAIAGRAAAFFGRES